MEEAKERSEKLTLVTRKSSFGLPTSCPNCLPVYLYLKFSKIPFNLDFNLTYPDSDQIPYIESGTYVAFNNEKGGVIPNFIKDSGFNDLDSQVCRLPEFISTKALLETWLGDAITFELWIGTEYGNCAYKIYYSDLPWPIGKILYLKRVYDAKNILGITKDNGDKSEEDIYRKANEVFSALSTKLGEDQVYLFDNMPTSLDAVFLGYALFMLHALPETSVLRAKFLEYGNLVRYAEKHKIELVDSDASQSDVASSSVPRGGPSRWSSKPKSKPKKEKTEEEKKFRRRAKYFLVTQMVAVLVFLSILGGGSDDDAEVELDEDYD